MTFDEIEVSTDSGMPALLVTFQREGKVWRYTNLENDVVFQSNTFLSVPLTMSSVTQSGDTSNEAVELSLPTDAAISVYYDQFRPSRDVAVVVRRIHMTQLPSGEFTPPTLPTDAPVCWVGTIANLKRPLPNQRTFVCTSLAFTMSKTGLRLTWQRSCPHFLYERGCWVNRDLHVQPVATVTLVNGLNIIAAEAALHPNGWFDGGYIEWQIEVGVTESRGIETQVGSTLTIFGGTDGLQSGSDFKLYAGCNRTPEHCNEKFNNILNYGGFHEMMGKSIFDGNPVF